MIDHIGFEVTELEQSTRFYDAVFFALGARRLLENEQAVAYGTDFPLLWVVARGQAPACGYGHIGLRANGKAAVDAAYRAGLQNGGRDDGEPGPRPQYGPGCYAAYLRDPDGLRVEVVSRR